MKSKRIIMSLVGVIITAISIGAFKYAALGVDPFQSFMSGIDTLIPIDFGTLYVIVNAILLLFALVFERHYIGIATFINLFSWLYGRILTEYDAPSLSYSNSRHTNACFFLWLYRSLFWIFPVHDSRYGGLDI